MFLWTNKKNNFLIPPRFICSYGTNIGLEFITDWLSRYDKKQMTFESNVDKKGYLENIFLISP